MSIEQLSGPALITVAIMIWFAWKIGYDSGYSKGQFDEEFKHKRRKWQREEFERKQAERHEAEKAETES